MKTDPNQRHAVALKTIRWAAFPLPVWRTEPGMDGPSGDVWFDNSGRLRATGGANQPATKSDERPYYGPVEDHSG